MTTTSPKTPNPTPPPLPPAAETDEADLLPGPPLVGSSFKFLQLNRQSLWTHTDTVAVGAPLSNGQGQAGTVISIVALSAGYFRATAGVYGAGDNAKEGTYGGAAAGFKAGKKPSSVFFVDFCSGVESAALLDSPVKSHEPPKTDPKVAQLLSTVAALTPEQRKALRESMGAEAGKAA